MNIKLGDKAVDVKDRLGATERRKDSEKNAHIKLDEKICAKCPHHMCIRGCPAGCFTLEEGKIVFNYEDCLECGTCDIMCDQGSVSWAHPRGTYGINYKFG